MTSRVSSTMKAYIYDCKLPSSMRFSNEVPKPSCGPNSLLIRVKAAAINPVDYKIPKIPILGHIKNGKPVGIDFSGVVETVGQHVQNFKVGDPVFGLATSGSLAEYCTAEPHKIYLKPESISFTDAASLPTAAVTSLQSLRAGGNGPRILIVGASGGCGAYGVQLAKAVGAEHVVGISSNDKFVHSMGADRNVNYKESDVKIALQGSQFDMIYDTVTSPDDPDYEKMVRCFLKPGGKYIAINGQASDWLRKLVPFVWQRSNYELVLTNQDSADLQLLARFISEGKLKPVIESEQNLWEPGALESTFTSLQARRSKGKKVFTVD